jgi:DNA polymerase III psi subunit
MKIRNGFVSNSSSSSFLLIIKKEDFETIEFTKLEKEVLNELNLQKDKIFDIDIMKISTLDDAGYNQLDDFSTDLDDSDLTEEEIAIMDDEGVYEIYEKILDKLETKEVYKHEICRG